MSKQTQERERARRRADGVRARGEPPRGRPVQGARTPRCRAPAATARSRAAARATPRRTQRGPARRRACVHATRRGMKCRPPAPRRAARRRAVTGARRLDRAGRGPHRPQSAAPLGAGSRCRFLTCKSVSLRSHLPFALFFERGRAAPPAGPWPRGQPLPGCPRGAAGGAARAPNLCAPGPGRRAPGVLYGPVPFQPAPPYRAERRPACGRPPSPDPARGARPFARAECALPCCRRRRRARPSHAPPAQIALPSQRCHRPHAPASPRPSLLRNHDSMRAGRRVRPQRTKHARRAGRAPAAISPGRKPCKRPSPHVLCASASHALAWGLQSIASGAIAHSTGQRGTDAKPVRRQLPRAARVRASANRPAPRRCGTSLYAR